ncbi:MAG: 3-hydroxyacyl-ACP dehydratase FabZ [Gammaproteobacteria bacterium]
MKESKHIDINQIMQILPHRYPFLLIDRILEYQIGESLRALKNVTVNEPFFQGHFPSRPVFPGVMILEAIAQASAILVSKSLEEDPGDNVIFLFAGIDKARFKRPVEPGDQLILEVKQTHYKRKIWKYSGQATVNDTLAASADIIFTYRNY